MSGQRYAPLKSGEAWVGRTVATLHDTSNSIGTYPAGTRFVVTRAYDGLHLKGYPCPACGVQPRITRVHTTDVRLVEADAAEPESVYEASQRYRLDGSYENFRLLAAAWDRYKAAEK